MKPSNKKGLFVGYNETSKAYKVYVRDSRKTMVSTDVMFEEDFASSKSHDLNLVTKGEDQEALKVELESLATSCSGQQPSDPKEEPPSPTSFVRIPR